MRGHELLNEFDLLFSKRAFTPSRTEIRKGVPFPPLMDDLGQRTMQGRKARGPQGVIPFPLEVPPAAWDKPQGIAGLPFMGQVRRRRRPRFLFF
jgi:hypothetical protein